MKEKSRNYKLRFLVFLQNESFSSRRKIASKKCGFLSIKVIFEYLIQFFFFFGYEILNMKKVVSVNIKIDKCCISGYPGARLQVKLKSNPDGDDYINANFCPNQSRSRVHLHSRFLLQYGCSLLVDGHSRRWQGRHPIIDGRWKGKVRQILSQSWRRMENIWLRPNPSPRW